MNEFLSEKTMVDALTSAAPRSYRRVLNIEKHGHKLLREPVSFICTVRGKLCLSSMGYKEFTQPQALHTRIKHFYLGVNTFTPVSEFDWFEAQHLCWIEMLRYLNELNRIKEEC